MTRAEVDEKHAEILFNLIDRHYTEKTEWLEINDWKIRLVAYGTDAMITFSYLLEHRCEDFACMVTRQGDGAPMRRMCGAYKPRYEYSFNGAVNEGPEVDIVALFESQIAVFEEGYVITNYTTNE